MVGLRLRLVVIFRCMELQNCQHDRHSKNFQTFSPSLQKYLDGYLDLTYLPTYLRDENSTTRNLIERGKEVNKTKFDHVNKSQSCIAHIP